jgi:hypothetical protein
LLLSLSEPLDAIKDERANNTVLLTRDYPSSRSIVAAVVIFSVMAPIGLIIGIILSSFGGDGNLDGPMTIIEAVATGLFSSMISSRLNSV